MDTSTSAASVEVAAQPEPSYEDRPLSATEARLGRLSRAILLALVVAVVLAAAAGSGLGASSSTEPTSDGARLGGDFPAFYAAGSIVRDGDIESLYDPARQEAAQVDLGIEGYLAFAYPPHVAALYAPLSLLGFRTAYALHTFLMAIALGVAVHVLARAVPLVRRWRWPLLASSFTFYPLFTAVGGGQNASLTVLLLALVWSGLHDDTPVVTGVAAGLLFYRPQYALPVIGLLLLARQFRAVGWAGVVAAGTWASVAAVLGGSWLTTWFDAVLPFVERDAEVNAENSISILGFLQAAWNSDGAAAVVVGALGAAAVVVVLMWFWVQPDRFSLADRMGCLALGMILISPHTMFYDASSMLIAGAALLAAANTVERRGRAVRVIAIVWIAVLVQLMADGFGATPLAIVVLISFATFVAQTVTSSEPTSSLVEGV